MYVVCRKVVFKEKRYLSIHLRAKNGYCAQGMGFCWFSRNAAVRLKTPKTGFKNDDAHRTAFIFGLAKKKKKKKKDHQKFTTKYQKQNFLTGRHFTTSCPRHHKH